MIYSCRTFFAAPSHPQLTPAPILTSPLRLTLLIAPLALACRPYNFAITLSIWLCLVTLVCLALWAGRKKRHPLPATLLLPILSLTLFALIAQLNPSSTFDISNHTFVPISSIKWLPTTVDSYNATLSLIQITAMLGAILLTFLCAKTETSQITTLRVMAIAGGAAALWSLLQKTGPLRFTTAWVGNYPWGNGEAVGPFEYHGNAGTFFNLCIPAIAASLIAAPTRARKCLWAILLATTYLAAVINISRTAFVITVVLSPLVIWALLKGTTSHAHLSEIPHARPRRRRWIIALLILFCLPIAVPIIAGKSVAFQRLGDIRKTLQNKYYDRYMQYETAWNLAKERPLLGGGPGAYRLLVQTTPLRGNYFAPAYVPGTTYSALSSASEDYLQTLVEWGVLGTTLWAILVLGAIIQLIRSFCRDQESRPTLLLIGVALAGVYLHALTDCPLQTPTLQLYTAIYLGIACATSNRSLDPHRP